MKYAAKTDLFSDFWLDIKTISSQNNAAMSEERIIGRQKEKAILELASRSPESEFVAVFGRRRVGKTHTWLENTLVMRSVSKSSGNMASP